MKLSVNQLDNRILPAVSYLSGTTLVIEGNDKPDYITVTTQAGQVRVDDTRSISLFDASQVTSIFATVRGGDDIVNILTPGINCVVDAGYGNDNIWTFGSDTIIGGPGNDIVYSIVGTSVIDGGEGKDRLIGNVTTTFLNDKQDRPNVVFGQTSQSPVFFVDGVVYINDSGVADNVLAYEKGNTLFVQYNGQSFSFDKNQVDTIASVLGNGNDVFVGTGQSRDLVLYGAGGDDVLIGGAGDDLFKGGGGNDVLLGMDGNDDLTGDGGADYLDGGRGMNILRVDLTDVYVGFGPQDIVLGM